MSRRLRWEIVLVLGVSLGRSAIYSVLSLAERLTRPEPLNEQTTSLNNSVVPDRVMLEAAYQVANLVLPLVPVALAVYLLASVQRPEDGPLRAIGFDLRRPGVDAAWGVGLFAAIGAAGLGLYLVMRSAGLNTNVAAAALDQYWWSVPLLILRAAMNGILEEVLMLGYLFTRWVQAGGRVVTVLVISALIRGSYHLYQGWGGFIGNALMGVIFGLVYLRTKRVMPLVITHTLLDVAAFVGYALLKDHLTWL